MFSIAVDAMSGENDPAAAVEASVRMARSRSDIQFILVGRESELMPLVKGAPDNLSLENAAEVVDMQETPQRAIRRRDTSMRRTMELISEGRAQAAVSAGNTGALLGLGLMVAGKVAGVTRPAIASFIPNPQLDGGCCMLDLGANMECSAEMLRQFALMGASLVSAVRGVEKPKIGLLNVGEEHYKGVEQIKQAAAMLQNMSGIDFCGNVEGFDIYLGNADVIVCDGFTGNVALKASEGLARMVSGMIRGAFRKDALSRVCGVLAAPVLLRLRQDMDARRYNGACFLGIRGLVVKSHGNADATAFYSALDYAVRAGQHNVGQLIEAAPQMREATA